MGLFGGRARGGHRKRVERGLAALATWQIRVHGRWVCPFCTTLAVRIPEGTPAELTEAVLDHLDGSCEQFAGGEGKERPLSELRRFATYRRLRRRVKNNLVGNPSWQLLDLSRRWFCPYCGDATQVRIPKSRKMTEDVLQGILDHVEGCYAFDRGQGQEKPFAHLKAVVRYANQSRKLAENVRRKLEGDPAWRRKDPRNRWVCPYCLVSQDHIDLSSNLQMFENAPTLIANHLAAACDVFHAGGQPKPLDTPQLSSTSSLGSDRQGIPSTKTEMQAVQPKPVDEDDVFLPREAEEAETPWGKDGRAAANRGTTLRELESSGEFLLINDPEVRSITSRRSKSREVDEWRQEIERELASVAEAPGLGGAVAADSDSKSDYERLGLDAHGLELGLVTLLAAPPQGGFSEVFELGEDRVALVAGGVTGADSEAPLISAMALNLIRHYSDPDVCPSEVLQRVNAEIFADLDGRSFVAVTYALVDMPTCRVRLARAGLSAPVLLNPTRRPMLQPIDSEGMVMGIDKGPIFNNTLEVRSLELAPADLLVLFTNGVLEARGMNREEFGIERMHQIIERYGTHEVGYFTDKFYEYFDLHLQNPTRRVDDACVVALRRLPSP